MVLPVLGIILACISLPLVIYAGQRTIGRSIPRPQIFRSVSAPAGKIAEGRPVTPPRRKSESEVDGGVTRVDTNASEASWLSTSTAETYVRGMGLEKVGLD